MVRFDVKPAPIGFLAELSKLDNDYSGEESQRLDAGMLALVPRGIGHRVATRPGAPVLGRADLLPQTIAIVKGRAEALDFEIEVADLSAGLPEGEISGIVLQQPGVSGHVADHSKVIADAKERGAMVTVAADLLALTLITPPGEQGADIAVGSAQRFGDPRQAGRERPARPGRRG